MSFLLTNLCNIRTKIRNEALAYLNGIPAVEILSTVHHVKSFSVAAPPRTTSSFLPAFGEEVVGVSVSEAGRVDGEGEGHPEGRRLCSTRLRVIY